jgi:hypothetical protein
MLGDVMSESMGDLQDPKMEVLYITVAYKMVAPI